MSTSEQMIATFASIIEQRSKLGQPAIFDRKMIQTALRLPSLATASKVIKDVLALDVLGKTPFAGMTSVFLFARPVASPRRG